jgi:tetratricopeptide (TPR) repeat protein
MKLAEQIKDEYRLFIRYKNMAGAYTELKDYENAGLYLEDALKLAEKSGDKSFLASCNMLFGKLHSLKNDHIIAAAFFRKSVNLYAEIGARHEQSEALVELSTTLLSQNSVTEAIKYAREALQIAESTGSLKGRLDASLCLAQCYDASENHDKAYFYLKSATALKDSIYTAEKYRTIEEVEAAFSRSELKKENEALTQNSMLQKQAIRTRNIILLLLAVSLLLGGALLRLIYRQRKAARKEAGMIKEQSEQKIEQLNEDLSCKERELTSKTIFINQKNQLLERMISELNELKKSEVSAQSIQHLQLQLKQELAPNAWKEFELQFNEVHPGFQLRLLEKYPELTPAERRLCSFIRLDMNTREISSLSGQSIKSIEVARTRIRKKLGVPHEQNLTNYIALI